MEDNKAKVLQFLIESFKRLGAKSPKIFQWWQNIGVALMVVGLIPDALTFLDITPTPVVAAWVSRGVIIAGLVAKFMAKLPVPDAAKTVANNPSELPFTSTVVANATAEPATPISSTETPNVQ